MHIVFVYFLFQLICDTYFELEFEILTHVYHHFNVAST